MSKIVVAIKDMSKWDKVTGESWQETKIFKSDEPIDNILKWAMDNVDYEYNLRTGKRITITVPSTDMEGFREGCDEK